MEVGIIGCGNIASCMADTIRKIPGKGIALGAVASRSLSKAEEFASRWGSKKAYGSYDELLADPGVDLVYIAVPHAFHKDIALRSIRAGKAVLCEKSFTVNRKEAEEVFDLAAKKGVYVAEAIWPRYMPSRKMIRDIIASGKIGRVRFISADLAYKVSSVERIAKPKLAGGALLDIGVYPLNFACMAEEGKKVASITGTCVKTEGGVDAREAMTLTFEDGVVASLYADTEVASDRLGFIYGTEGMIQVQNINNPEKITVWDDSRPPRAVQSFDVTEDATGYEYELYAAKRDIEAGSLEPKEMPWKETLRMMDLMDSLRRQWGIRLAGELS